MDGFGGYKTAARAAARSHAVMDPFHVVALAGTKLDLCRQRVQQQTCGHRGRTGDPLYGVRRTLRTRLPLLSTRQKDRLTAVFADDAHLAVVVTWSVYQRIIAAYSQPDRRRGKTMMTTIIDSLRRGVPTGWKNSPNSAAPCTGAATTYWPTSTTTPPTAPPKPSTAASKHYAATPSDSATSPTTESAHYCTAATSPNRSMHSDSGRANKRIRHRGRRDRPARRSTTEDSAASTGTNSQDQAAAKVESFQIALESCAVPPDQVLRTVARRVSRSEC